MKNSLYLVRHSYNVFPLSGRRIWTLSFVILISLESTILMVFLTFFFIILELNSMLSLKCVLCIN